MHDLGPGRASIERAAPRGGFAAEDIEHDGPNGRVHLVDGLAIALLPENQRPMELAVDIPNAGLLPERVHPLQHLANPVGAGEIESITDLPAVYAGVLGDVAQDLLHALGRSWHHVAQVGLRPAVVEHVLPVSGAHRKRSSHSTFTLPNDPSYIRKTSTFTPWRRIASAAAALNVGAAWSRPARHGPSSGNSRSSLSR